MNTKPTQNEKWVLFTCDIDSLTLLILIQYWKAEADHFFKHPLTFPLVISFSIELLGIRSQEIKLLGQTTSMETFKDLQISPNAIVHKLLMERI